MPLLGSKDFGQVALLPLAALNALQRRRVPFPFSGNVMKHIVFAVVSALLVARGL